MCEKNYSVRGPNFDEYIVCPYNSAHRVLPVRLTYHLTRCARNYPLSKMVRCPYNTTHFHDVGSMQEHIIECPNRTSSEPDKLSPGEAGASNFIVETSEDWDADPPAPTYNPLAHCEQHLVLRNPQGLPPAARREFRERERRRFKEINQP
ncbi:gametocyte-specific factor 1 homolog [Drosophila gunungcola]|uniref:CHHC U11-48K-type domain-containing protein n=1 Tax=Drosophila gunungcola TaxID=103775 RepID=A0A9P9YV04_9MUSC|nr:gametocyte-specific factor 1 homolog [Drosophila gunungcola]KAI8043576.1 hypothetical protein M5D96_004908 [Drosophila gunungcola]